MRREGVCGLWTRRAGRGDAYELIVVGIGGEVACREFVGGYLVAGEEGDGRWRMRYAERGVAVLWG